MDRERLERLLSALHRTDSSTSVLHRLCVVCTDTTALAGAGVSRISSGRHEMVVASDSTAAHVEMLQISLAEGPCLEVMASFHPSLEPDLASTRARGRWPNFARAALDHGIAATFAFPLITGGVAIGALDVYSRQTGDMASDQLADALLLAHLAALAVDQLDAGSTIEGVDLSTEPAEPWAHAAVVHNATRSNSASTSTKRFSGSAPWRSSPNGPLPTFPVTSSPESSASNHGAMVIKPTTDGDREIAIVDAFVYLSDTLVADYDVIEFLHFLTERCVEFSAVDEAAVMLAAPSGLLQSVASSSERSRLLELFELQNQDGPCLDAYRSGIVVSSPDLSLDRDRWPTFAPHALDVGFKAVHSVPLKLREDVIGALNLLRVEPGHIIERDATVLRALSDIATVGILQERLLNQATAHATGLHTVLASRISIEQAKGILAQRNNIQVDDAFDKLRVYARHNGLRLTDVATGVVNRTLDP